MIVSLDELKHVLGMDSADVSQDAELTRQIGAATEWVQRTTHRRFDTPIQVTEYRESPGQRLLYLAGHIDDSVAADNPSETLDPSTSLQVFRRPMTDSSFVWEALIEDEDWERRDDALLFIRVFGVWPCEDEYKINYLDGYAVAPDDVKALVLEIASNQYLIDSALATGTAGITSESLGDFSYSTSGKAEGTTVRSETSIRTLNNRTRKLV